MHKLNVEEVFFKKLSLTFKADDVTSNAKDVSARAVKGGPGGNVLTSFNFEFRAFQL